MNTWSDSKQREAIHQTVNDFKEMTGLNPPPNGKLQTARSKHREKFKKYCFFFSSATPKATTVRRKQGGSLPILGWKTVWMQDTYKPGD